MQFAIVSDLHANLPALDAVMRALPSGAELLHLGDVVGYGGEPNKLIARLRQARGVRGNHDDAVLGNDEVAGQLNVGALFSAAWTQSVLTEQSRTYLASLPYVLTIEDDASLPFTLVHGSPCKPESFPYIWVNADAMRATKHFETPICFVGHSHHPMSFARPAKSGKIIAVKRGVAGIEQPDVLSIEDGMQYVVNVGSVGQPRDRNPKACFVVLDTTDRTVTWHRVAYDIERARWAIDAAGLPDYNGARLVDGR